MTKKSYWKWLGNREFVPGCPARDLSLEEVEEKGIQELVETSNLYELIQTQPKKVQKEGVSNGA